MANEKHYVDNKQFFTVLMKYKKQVAKAPEKPPPIPEYIGDCLLKIATRLSHKANFANYSFRDDMISDAVENMVMYLNNFNPEKSKNPFAYFTQIAHFAFLRRIDREKKHVYVKYKYAMHKAQQQEDFATQDGDVSGIKEAAWLSYDNVQSFVRDYEAKLARNRAIEASKSNDEEYDSDIVPFDILDDENDDEHEYALDGEREVLGDEDEEQEADEDSLRSRD